MCPYRRSLYSCNHAQLSSEPVKPCQAQKNYDSGAAKEPCGIVETHRPTIRIPKQCGPCEAKKMSTDQTLAFVKKRMASLRTCLNERHNGCMKRLDEAGAKREKVPETAKTAEKIEDPAQAFLRKKMMEDDSHLMMLSSL
ncbi:Uu.00g019390.m01.CDS01 [Anthostomella pinea]|uniref:Uu.00g019390.m01.CDS01 n=1 Tax=Anthostomella pinea TaxID=933095 RepID=A0AAI8YQR7_9PEZI|nr:Uu.00g019390.m01.CDS01 [Anthostomella pinea]